METALRLVAENDLAGDGRRESKRSRVMLAATMMTGAAEIAVVIRELSSSGAMITTPVAPCVGSFITLRRDAICFVAQVVWRDENKVGLQFRDQVDETALLIDLRRPGTVAAH